MKGLSIILDIVSIVIALIIGIPCYNYAKTIGEEVRIQKQLDSEVNKYYESNLVSGLLSYEQYLNITNNRGRGNAQECINYYKKRYERYVYS